MSDKSNKPSRRDQIRQRQRRQKSGSRMIFTAAAVVVLVFVGYQLWLTSSGTKAPTGEVGIPKEPMEDSSHVEDGTDVDYNTNPPTSGPHFGQTVPAGFYNIGDAITLIPFGESHIVHNLEHGYVVFWYNCNVLDAAGCTELKSQIQAVLEDVGGFKVIVFPWIFIEEPLVMTSWGMIQPFRLFDSQLAAEFVLANRSNARAPESNVP